MIFATYQRMRANRNSWAGTRLIDKPQMVLKMGHMAIEHTIHIRSQMTQTTSKG